MPHFLEAVGVDIVPQIYDYDWTLEGVTTDNHGGRWARPGTTIEVRLQSPLYQPLAQSLVVPDVDPAEDGSRWFRPDITVQRLTPALLRAEWSADFTHPTIRIEIYAPFGLAGVSLTSTSVYYQACLEGTPFPCDEIITGSVGGDPWSDLTATATQGWADITGRWTGWPSGMPPEGYVGEVGTPGWSTTLNVNIKDDHAHVGHGACGGGLIPSESRTLGCGVLYTQ
jgi:hypothetical protein